MKLKLDYDITKPTFRYVESLWFRRLELSKRLREIEMESKMYESDENADIKGQGKTSDPVADIVIQYEFTTQSLQYKSICEQLMAIDNVYNKLPEGYKKIIHLRYWSGRTAPTWEYVSQQTGYSVRQCLRVRDMIVVTTARELNMW